MITRITGKHQITVPAEIVGKAGLKPGMRLDWNTTDRKDVLEVRILPDSASVAESLRGRGNAFHRREGGAVRRLIEERDREEEGRRQA